MLGNHWRRTHIELPFDRHFWQLNWIKENKNPCGSCRNLQRNFTSGNQWKTISSDINYINCIGTDTILVFSKYLYHQYSATSMHLYKHLMQKGAKNWWNLAVGAHLQRMRNLWHSASTIPDAELWPKTLTISHSHTYFLTRWVSPEICILLQIPASTLTLFVTKSFSINLQVTVWLYNVF